MNEALVIQKNIFESVVSMTAAYHGTDLTNHIILSSFATTLIGWSGLEYLRIAEQALRSCGCKAEAQFIHRRYQTEIAAARDD